ncbi:MAG: quinone oxidoreductase [Pleurocapsa minor GSE-CHR-MK-17-07R]|jgi:NADPH2:quinone reductase|nr:quinone oxidoreductase [Pleurocapsa minor GSE-CHR-MK 17-07R]
MRVIQVTEHGGPEVLTLVELPQPAPAAGGVVVKNEAIGVNYVDVQHRAGGYYPVALPLIPGIEAAGVVVQVGAGVTDFRAGDRVAYGGYMGGNYAEYTPVPADKLVPVPASVDFEQAVAGLMQGMTAHCLTSDVYAVREGDWALVQAAAGGVGSLLVQYAKLRGATVIGTVSSARKADFARQMGADHVVNYRTHDFAAEVERITGGQGVHVVYDAVGAPTFDGSLASLRACGHLVVYGQTGGAVPPFDINRLSGLTDSTSRGSISLTWAALSHYNAGQSAMLARAAAVFEDMQAGRLRPYISMRLPLADAAHAHRLLEDRDALGKIVLLP